MEFLIALRSKELVDQKFVRQFKFLLDLYQFCYQMSRGSQYCDHDWRYDFIMC